MADNRYSLTLRRMVTEVNPAGVPSFYNVNLITVRFGEEYKLKHTTDVWLECADEVYANEDANLVDTLTLQGVNLTKRIGQHNTLVMDFQYMVETSANVRSTVRSFADISRMFIRCLVELRQREDKDSADGTDFVTARSYVVSDVKPKFIAKSAPEDGKVTYTFNLRLTAMSWDVLMDMTRYSRAYTAKRLGEDIMADMVGVIGMGDLATKDFPKGCVKEKVEESVIKGITDGMRVLRATRTKDETSDEFEMRLPYLVQFNETDYEFLLRTASRFGEFLYFENGVLNLGLTRVCDSNAEEVVKKVEAGETASIELMERVDQDRDASVSMLKSTEYDDCAEHERRPYVAEFANDDFFDVIAKGSYDSKEEEMEKMQPALWSRMLSVLFQYKNLSSFTLETAIQEGAIAEVSSLKADYSNKSYDKKFFNYDDESTQYEKVDKEYRFAQFADLFGSSSKESYNIDKKYRPDSKKIWSVVEEERRRALTRYLIRFDGLQKDLQLGDLVRVDDVDGSARFVVVSVETVADSDGENYMEVIVIPETRSAVDEKAMEAAFRPDMIAMPLPVDVSLVRSVGAQAAVVADADDPKRLGRVRVRYHWQKDGDATPWIRVAVPFAANEGAGMFSQFNEGDEVMVDYECGNVERPYVVGALFNSSSGTPFGQRGYKQVFCSRNGHMLGVKEPKSGFNMLQSFLPGLKLFSYVPGLLSATGLMVTDRDVQRAMGGFEISDTYGIYKIETSSDKREITVESPFGTVNMSAAMGITISAPNGNVKIVGKNVDIVAGNNLTLKSGVNIDTALLSVNSGEGAVRVLGAEAMSLAGVGASLFDMPALRFAVELLFKPIAGTLKIHSGRYLMLESGGGEAQMHVGSNSWLDRWNGNEPYDKRNALIEEIVKDCMAFKGYLKSYKESLIKAYGEILKEKEYYVVQLNTILRTLKVQDKEPDDVLREFVFNDNATEISRDNLEKFIVPKEAKGLYSSDMIMAIITLSCNLPLFKNMVNSFDVESVVPKVPDFNARAANLPVVHYLLVSYSEFKTEAEKMNRFKNDKTVNVADDVVYATGDFSPESIYKAWVEKYLRNNLDALQLDAAVELDGDMNNWVEFLGGIKEIKPGFWNSLVVDNLLKQSLDNLLPWDFWNIYCWKAGTRGDILMSTNKNETYYLNGKELKLRKFDIDRLRSDLNDTTI